jgi:hypothetical protein
MVVLTASLQESDSPKQHHAFFRTLVPQRPLDSLLNDPGLQGSGDYGGHLRCLPNCHDRDALQNSPRRNSSRMTEVFRTQ